MNAGGACGETFAWLRVAVLCALYAALLLAPATGARAQGVTTGAIRGSVRDGDGGSVAGARVRAVNASTGFAAEAVLRHGWFRIEGLEPGGPYVVDVEAPGYHMQRSEPAQLHPGESVVIHFVLQPAALVIDTLRITARSGVPAGGGAVTTITEPLLRQLPTLDRNFQDFVALAPHVSTKVGYGRTGVSAAGANLRFNSFLVNGADERAVNGSVSAGSNIGRSVPLDAVKEYQVLVAPYDVRYGDFAGALVNTITHSGTNELRGSAFTYWRNDALGRDAVSEGARAYDRLQYGGTMSGPLRRDRLHFIAAADLQRLTEPAAGPYAGTAAPLPVSQSDLDRLDAIMRGGHGLVAGSAGRVIKSTPLYNIFARLDGWLPSWRTRATAFVTDARTAVPHFSRVAAPDTFALSSYRYASEIGLRMIALQVYTDLGRSGNAHNELMVSSIADQVDHVPAVRQPLVRVLLTGTAGGQVVVTAGTAEPAHGRFGRSRSVRVRDELTMAWRSGHALVLGAQVERFDIRRGGVIGGYGMWTFNGLDALETGAAERYELRTDFGTASAPLGGWQYAAWLGDEWRPADRLTLTFGVRADRLAVDGHAPYNAAVDSIFGRRTDVMPRMSVRFSPRVGFTWDLPSERDRLRGGAGIFTGRPPLAWLVPVLANHGVGTGDLRCGYLPGDRGPPPAFVTDQRTPPTQCATGPPLAASANGDVDLAARDLGMARSLRASLAWERRLPHGVLATLEAVGTRYISDFMFVNLNLPGPRATDRFGRVIYGVININGVTDSMTRSSFAQVIELRNVSRNHAAQVSARVERQAAHGAGGALSWTYSRVRDVQSPSRVNQRGIAMWADARAVSGRHDDLTPGISLNDIPHRMVAALTYRPRRERWATSVAFYWIGESGSPFTYIATGIGRRGDLNADGSNANDPIYVPRHAGDPAEIRFQPFTRQLRDADGMARTDTVSAAQQAEAFERFIEGSPCLRGQRGRILARNSCREPSSHTTVMSLRQGIPAPRGSVEAELDVFNVLNLLNPSWGRRRAARPRLLDHVGHTGATETAQPIFRFDPARTMWDTIAIESAFQLQLGLRYRF